jgi:hypothetical protein
MPRGPAVDDDEVEHLAARVHAHVAEPTCRAALVRAEQELLTRLAAGVERARHLSAAERRLSSMPPYSRANGTPCATHWSMMLTLTAASGRRWPRGRGSRRPSACRRNSRYTLSPSF